MKYSTVKFAHLQPVVPEVALDDDVTPDSTADGPPSMMRHFSALLLR